MGRTPKASPYFQLCIDTDDAEPKGHIVIGLSLGNGGLFSGIRLPYHSTGTPKGHTTTSHVLNDVSVAFDGAFE